MPRQSSQLYAPSLNEREVQVRYWTSQLGLRMMIRKTQASIRLTTQINALVRNDSWTPSFTATTQATILAPSRWCRSMRRQKRLSKPQRNSFWSRLSRSSPETQLLYQLIVSGIILLPISLLFDDFVRELNSQLVLIFSFQVIVIMCLGFIGWLWVMSKYSASNTSSFSFLTPIFGVLFGWLIMDDAINEQIYISLFLTCLGIYLINRKTKKS